MPLKLDSQFARALLLVIFLLLVSLASRLDSTILRFALIISAPVVIFVLVKNAQSAMILLPFAASLPVRPIQLAGGIGLIEITLALLLAVGLLQIGTAHRPIYIDKFLLLMAAIAVIIALSVMSNRGSYDVTRLTTWLGAMLCYFLALNMTMDMKDVRPLLFMSAFIVISSIGFDLVLHSTQYDLTNPRELEIYRALGTSIGVGEGVTTLGGQSNYVANIAFLFMPIAVSFAVFERGVYRWVSMVLLVSCAGLAMLMASRSFFLIVGICGLGLAGMQHLPRKKVSRVMTILVLAFCILAYFYPQLSSFTLQRLLGTIGGESRVGIWDATFMASTDALLFGHGAIGSTLSLSLYDTAAEHNLLLQVLFEYGVVMIIPSIILLVWWFSQTRLSLRLTEETCAGIQSATAASYLVMLGTLAYSTLTVALFFRTAYASLAFMLMAISSVQKRQLDAQQLTSRSPFR